ncbi:MAG: UpxY family transcription antiterminator [Acidobacteriia bacterium]|nr:UpxY family transcription antiterminator [Terriglobia bacterium]
MSSPATVMSTLLSSPMLTLAPAGLAEASPAEWYALYTRSRHEKQVAARLQQLDIEYFLPVYSSVRRWKDRRVNLQLPLFPGYIFVQTSFQHRIQVLSVPGALRFVAFSGRPAALPESDLLRLRIGLDHGIRAQPHPYLKVGRRVRVCSGPLAGTEGILLRKKNQFRLIVSIDLIMRSVAVEIDSADVEPVR